MQCNKCRWGPSSQRWHAADQQTDSPDSISQQANTAKTANAKLSEGAGKTYKGSHQVLVMVRIRLRALETEAQESDVMGVVAGARIRSSSLREWTGKLVTPRCETS
jgi:hypothetical protein